MISAVVLVNTDIGAQTRVLKSLKQVEGIEEAHELCSVYDLVFKIKATSLDNLKEIITQSVRKIAGVSTVMTLLLSE